MKEEKKDAALLAEKEKNKAESIGYVKGEGKEGVSVTPVKEVSDVETDGVKVYSPEDCGSISIITLRLYLYTTYICIHIYADIYMDIYIYGYIYIYIAYVLLEHMCYCVTRAYAASKYIIMVYVAM